MIRSRWLTVAAALLVVMTVQVAYAVPTAITARMSAADCCLRKCEAPRLTANRQCCNTVESAQDVTATFSARDRLPAMAALPSGFDLDSPHAFERSEGARDVGSHDRVLPIFLRTLSLRL